MIRLRSAWLSNVKLLLMFLVVAGHCMEQTGFTGSISYKIIYLFHMPAFAFLSGTGLKTRKRCLKSAVSAAVTYAAAQGTVVLYGKMTGEKGAAVSWLTPYWHLWYLMSLVFWSFLVWVYYTVGETIGRKGSELR